MGKFVTVTPTLLQCLSSYFCYNIYWFHQIISVVPAGTIQISVNQDGSPIAQGLQTLTMTNANPSTTTAANASAGATIVQYAQGPDGQQYYIPGTCKSRRTSMAQTPLDPLKYV